MHFGQQIALGTAHLRNNKMKEELAPLITMTPSKAVRQVLEPNSQSMITQAVLRTKTQITSNQRTSQRMDQQELLCYLSLMREFNIKLNKAKDLGNHFIILVVQQRILMNEMEHLRFLTLKCYDLK